MILGSCRHCGQPVDDRNFLRDRIGRLEHRECVPVAERVEFDKLFGDGPGIFDDSLKKHSELRRRLSLIVRQETLRTSSSSSQGSIIARHLLDVEINKATAPTGYGGERASGVDRCLSCSQSLRNGDGVYIVEGLRNGDGVYIVEGGYLCAPCGNAGRLSDRLANQLILDGGVVFLALNGLRTGNEFEVEVEGEQCHTDALRNALMRGETVTVKIDGVVHRAKINAIEFDPFSKRVDVKGRIF